jgi:hypothetical protein
MGSFEVVDFEIDFSWIYFKSVFPHKKNSREIHLKIHSLTNGVYETL